MSRRSKTEIRGYTLAIRIVIFAILPSWGLSGAAATMVGQSLGAGKPDRAERSVWVTGFYNMVYLGLVGLIFIIFTDPIIRLFTHDPEVVTFAVDALRFVSFGNVAYAYDMVMVQSFNGAGDTVTPTIINLFCYWLWEIPLAYALAVLAGFGPRGVFLSITIAEATIAIVGAAVFRRGRWKLKEI